MDDLDALYAEWRAMNDAREAAEEASSVPAAPTEAVDGNYDELGVSVTQIGEAAPRASQESVEPMCPCCGEALDFYTSPATGRRYLPQVTPAGVRYGLEPRTRFVHLEVRGHSVERGSAGWPVVDRFATQLEAKLQIWTEAVETAKVYAYRPQDRAALDALVFRWVRWPASWKTTRRHILAVTGHVVFKATKKREAMLAFQRRSFAASFEPQGPDAPPSPENVPLIP